MAEPQPGVIWVEPFAGTLAVWTALHLGRPMPPIAYMGSKRRFAAAILGALTLSRPPGRQGEQLSLLEVA